jgi:hypothetical protein
MPRIVSRGEIRKMLLEFAEKPEKGVSVVYRELPQTITRQVYEMLDEDGKGFYVPGEVAPGQTTASVLNGEARYLTYRLPAGTYDAFMVKEKGET